MDRPELSPAPRGLRIGLTGGIGSGKSTVARRFAALGARVVDTDALAHALTAPGGAAIPAIAAAFLGATTVRPGQFNVLGTIIGVFFVAISVSGLTLAGAQAWVPPVFYGASLALAVLLSTLLARRRAGQAT